MELYELKPYILESCKFLGIMAREETPTILNITIPIQYANEFNQQTDFKISFEKTNDPRLTYVTFESYFTQKIAHLVAEINSGVSSGTRLTRIDDFFEKIEFNFPNCDVKQMKNEYERTDYLIVWFKTTIDHSLVDEYLKGYKYNLSNGSIDAAPAEDEINHFLHQINEELVGDISNDDIDIALSKLYPIAELDAKRFVSIKEEEKNKVLNEEVKRINDYYDLLKSENQLAESSKGLSPQEEIDLLEKERKELIEQQHHKSHFTEQKVTIEPVALLLLKDLIETTTITIENHFGYVQSNLRADKEPIIQCEFSGEKEGPFTLTSDNQVVALINSFECSNCNNLFALNKNHKCTVCQEDLCNDCKKISALSSSVLCNKHTELCHSCLKSVSPNELHLCKHCNQFYCKECNPTDLCHLCDSIKPVTALTPDLKKIIDTIPSDLKAKKFEISEQGNRIVLLGKGRFFKSYFIVYDKVTSSIISTQRYGAFNKKL